MEYNVENWLNDRGYKTASDGETLSVSDKTGKSYVMDTSGFGMTEKGFTGDGNSIRAALAKSGAGAPQGYTPLRNTLAAKGVTVGYDKTADAPIVNGQMLNGNDSRLLKLGDDYWIEENYAKSLVPRTYQNPYKNEIKSVLDTLTDMRFSYNPEQDMSLRHAQDEAMLAAKQSANARGLLGGSTAEIMRQRAAQDLVPVYEQLAYSRFQDERKAQTERLSLLESLAENAFAEYLGEEKQRLAQKTYALEAQTAADTEAYRAAQLRQEKDIASEKLQFEKENATADRAHEKDLLMEELRQKMQMATEDRVAKTDIENAKLSQEERIAAADRDAKTAADNAKLSQEERIAAADRDAKTAADNAKLSQEERIATANREADKEIEMAKLKQKTDSDIFMNQLEKVLAIGEVDAEASAILGLPVGTLTSEQKNFIASLQQAANEQAEKFAHEILMADKKHANDLKLQEEKYRLDTDSKIKINQYK